MALALCLAGGSACSATVRQTPDDTIVMLVEKAIKTADGRYTSNAYDQKLSRLVTRGLTTLNPRTLEPELDLAEAIAMQSPTEVLVTLRPNLRFSTGTPLTAADVAFTFQSIIAPGSDSSLATATREKIADVAALSDRVVRFRLHAPLATLWADLEVGIVSQAAVDAHGHFAGGRAVGAGPYVVSELTAQRARLVVNPYYDGTPPIVPNVEMRFVTAQPARALMMAGGGADLVQNAVQVDLLDDLAKRPRIAIESAPSVLLTYLMLNHRDPLLADVRVRRAIAHALDRPAIIAAKFGGRAVVATGLIAPTHWSYFGDVATYGHDVARAKALLDEAGHLDPDGDGPRPRFSLVYKSSADPFRVAIARVIASQLAQIGIAVEVRAFEFATMFADVKQGNYQLASMQTAEITDPDYLYVYFHSTQAPSKSNPNGTNRWYYASPTFDALVEAGRRELDRDKRLELYRRAQQVFAEDLPVVPLWHEDNVAVHNVALHGYQLSANARFGGLAFAAKR